MYPSPEHHLQAVIADFEKNVTEKYKAGQKEHGGQLWTKPGMIKNLKDELLDAYVYLCTLEAQINDMGAKFGALEESVDNQSGQDT